MNKHRFHSLAMITLVLVAGPWQYSSGQTAAQAIDREGSATNIQKESVGSSLAPAQTKTYKFRSVDVPGAYLSSVRDYNGTIAVGSSSDTVSSGSSAFFFKSNVFKAIKPASSAINSSAEGVNKSGQIVGWYEDALGTYHGFVSDGTNALTFDYPGATGTTLLDINDSGDIAGTSSQGGFLYNKNKNTFTLINYPSATGTTVFGVNSSDVVVGTYTDSAAIWHGFLWNDGVFSGIDYPGATGGTIAVGINDSGLIAGFYDLDGFDPVTDSCLTARPARLSMCQTGKQHYS